MEERILFQCCCPMDGNMSQVPSQFLKHYKIWEPKVIWLASNKDSGSLSEQISIFRTKRDFQAFLQLSQDTCEGRSTVYVKNKNKNKKQKTIPLSAYKYRNIWRLNFSPFFSMWSVLGLLVSPRFRKRISLILTQYEIDSGKSHVIDQIPESFVM